MVLINQREFRQLRHPYYIINFILALSFIFLKNVPPLCQLIFNSCELDYVNILFYFIIIIIIIVTKIKLFYQHHIYREKLKYCFLLE